MRDTKALFKAGNKAQLEKLEINIHKDDWNKLTFNELCGIIDEEFDEATYEMNSDIIDYLALRLECADLANGCHFMIELCDKKIKEGETV